MCKVYFVFVNLMCRYINESECKICQIWYQAKVSGQHLPQFQYTRDNLVAAVYHIFLSKTCGSDGKLACQERKSLAAESSRHPGTEPPSRAMLHFSVNPDRAWLLETGSQIQPVVPVFLLDLFLGLVKSLAGFHSCWLSQYEAHVSPRILVDLYTDDWVKSRLGMDIDLGCLCT